MTRIYAVRQDSYKYQELDLLPTDIIHKAPAHITIRDLLDFSDLNISMSDWWPSLDAHFKSVNDSNDPIPDISPWINASLVLSPKAYRLLGDLLKPWGEFLPITILQGETWYIFNCLTFGKVIEDQCEMSYYDGEELGVKTIVFDEQDVKERLIYKNTYNRGQELYCGDRFKDAVESLSLEGVQFSKKLVEDFNSPS